MIEKQIEIRKNLMYIIKILSNVSSIEGLAISLYKGVSNIECVVLCVQYDNNITEDMLYENFRTRNNRCEFETGMKVRFKVVPSKNLAEKVEGYNALIMKELMNSEIILDREGRLVKIQNKLIEEDKDKLGTYFHQMDLESAIRSLTM